jgi:hypothetical protein
MLSWRFIFIVDIPVGLLAIILGFLCIPCSTNKSVSKLDIPGILLLFITLASLIFGLNTITGPNASHGIIALVLAVIFCFLFLVRQKRSAEPLMDLSLFKNRRYSFQNADILILQLGLAGVNSSCPFIWRL